jgi:hypothetical protein
LVGGIYDTPHNENQKDVYRFVNVDKSKQIEALRFLDTNLWATQNWLMKPELISQIRGEGVLNSIQALQLQALARLLNTSKLNRMLSSDVTLKGVSLGVNELINSLFDSIFTKSINPDYSQQRLQLHFVERIDALLKDEKLNQAIKSVLLDVKKDIFSYAKSRSKKSDGILKNHFAYLKKIIDL